MSRLFFCLLLNPVHCFHLLLWYNPGEGADANENPSKEKEKQGAEANQRHNVQRLFQDTEALSAIAWTLPQRKSHTHG